MDGEIDKNKYAERYKLFSEYFYKPFFGKEYPLDPEVQYTEYDDDDVSIIGLNSCYQIDHKQPKKSGINGDSIVKCPALMDTSSKIKLAVWHHPIYGEDCIAELDFLSILAVTGFKAFFTDMFMRPRIRILSMMISSILVQLGQELWAQRKKRPSCWNSLTI